MTFLNRATLFLVILLVVGGCSLWILGGKKNEYSTTIEIDRLPQQVFPYLTQPDKLKQWSTAIVEIDELEAQVETELPTPLAKTNRVMRLGGKNLALEDQVIRFSVGEMLTVQSMNPSLVLTSIYQLEMDPNGSTKFEYRSKVANLSLGRFMAPLKDLGLLQQMQDDSRRLKELVEANEPKMETPSMPAESELGEGGQPAGSSNPSEAAILNEPLNELPNFNFSNSK